MSARTQTPTYQAMLAKTGFADTDALYAAIKTADGAEERALHCLAKAFLELEFAEDQVTRALRDMTGNVAKEEKHLAEGYRVDSMWVAQAGGKIAEYTAKMQAACEQIQMLTWIYTGKPQG